MLPSRVIISLRVSSYSSMCYVSDIYSALVFDFVIIGFSNTYVQGYAYSHDVTYTSNRNKFEFDTRQAIADAFSIVLPAGLFVLFLAADTAGYSIKARAYSIYRATRTSLPLLLSWKIVLFLLGDFRERLALLDPNKPSIDFPSISHDLRTYYIFKKNNNNKRVMSTTWRKEFEKIWS